MAWYNSGTWTDLPAETAVPNICHELIWAINERVDALTGDVAANGVAVNGSNWPTVADLCDVAFEDFYEILADMRDVMTDMLYWVVSTETWFARPEYTYSTTYGYTPFSNFTLTSGQTMDALLLDVSGQSTWVRPWRVQNATMWIQMRQALEVMRYICVPATVVSGNDTKKEVLGQASWETAWTNCLADTSPVTANFLAVVAFQWANPYSLPNSYGARIKDDSPVTLTLNATPGGAGTMTRALRVYGPHRDGSLYCTNRTSRDLWLTLGGMGDTIVVEADSGNGPTGYDEEGEFSEDADAVIETALELKEVGGGALTTPSPLISGGSWDAHINIDIGGIWCLYDIQADMTYG